MNDLFSAAIGGFGVGIVGFLIAWGAVRSKVTDNTRRIEELEDEVPRQLELIHSLRDVYVSYKHFNEMMSTIRETQRELKDDMKKIIALLTERPL